MVSRHSARYLVTHGRLLWRIAGHELRARYAESLLGMSWVFLYPLVVLGIYAVLYVFIFQVRPNQMRPIEYVLYMFSGLVPFMMASESLSSGVTAVVASRSVLNNTVFPIDLAPIKPVLLSQGVAIVGFSAIVLAAALTRKLGWSAALLPVIWLFQILFLVGLNWMVSLVHVIFRDLRYLTSLGLMVALLASPIAYTPDMVPSGLRPIILVNPLAHFVMAYQKILVMGELPPKWELLCMAVLAFASFALGGWVFAGGKRVLIDYV
jgi:lipopolysaccharide transport system permease protein